MTRKTRKKHAKNSQKKRQAGENWESLIEKTRDRRRWEKVVGKNEAEISFNTICRIRNVEFAAVEKKQECRLAGENLPRPEMRTVKFLYCKMLEGQHLG
jgi:hypothetical protein